jgi:hypothetical protein
MNPIVGWSLAAVAVALAWLQWGWQGPVLALTMIVFWLLLQFSRALRAMRLAAQAPVGRVPSAVMLHAKLRRGRRLLDILPLTGSLGEKVANDPETFVWRDASGASVRVELVRGRCVCWRLERPADVKNPAEAGFERNE